MQPIDTSTEKGSSVLFLMATDLDIYDNLPSQRFQESIWAKGIHCNFAGALANLSNFGEAPKTRDIAWAAGGRYVVALGEAAQAACRDQNVAYEAFPDIFTADEPGWAQIESQLCELSQRLPLDKDRYLAVKQRLSNMGFAHEWEWAQTITPPDTAEDFAANAIWVICCSGFREQAARVTERKVWDALDSDRSALEVFPKSGKGKAIDTIWANRQAYFDAFHALLAAGAPAENVIAWLEQTKIPYVSGGILRYHFAKNLGVDCAKPDRWLCRLAGIPETGDHKKNFKVAMDLCRALAESSGDRIATVDVVLWRACNMSVLTPAPIR